MSDVYTAYLEANNPPLPEGYSFKIAEDEYRLFTYEFQIIGPPRGVFRTRRAEYLTDAYTGPGDYGRVNRVHISQEVRESYSDPIVAFVRGMRDTYAMWRNVSYVQDEEARWGAYVGTHP